MVVKRDTNGDLRLQQVEGDAETETVVWECSVKVETLLLKVIVESGALCMFQFSLDHERFEQLEQLAFQATVSRWVGAKVGLFAQAEEARGGFVDFDWFTITKTP